MGSWSKSTRSRARSSSVLTDELGWRQATGAFQASIAGALRSQPSTDSVAGDRTRWRPNPGSRSSHRDASYTEEVSVCEREHVTVDRAARGDHTIGARCHVGECLAVRHAVVPEEPVRVDRSAGSRASSALRSRRSPTRGGRRRRRHPGSPQSRRCRWARASGDVSTSAKVRPSSACASLPATLGRPRSAGCPCVRCASRRATTPSRRGGRPSAGSRATSA